MAIRVHVIIKGRIGDAWLDVDEHVKLPDGTTLAGLVDGHKKLQLRHALDNSPHLTETLMLNGERTPFAENAERVLQDGDEIYLLAPLAGGW